MGPKSGAFTTVLKAEEIRADRRLFLTATPRYFTGRVKNIAKEESLAIASMDEKKDFGPEFHKLTFGKAIQRGRWFKSIRAHIKGRPVRRGTRRFSFLGSSMVVGHVAGSLLRPQTAILG